MRPPENEGETVQLDSALRDDLEAISDALEAASFRLPLADQPRRERLRREMATGVRRFLRSQRGDPDAPVVAVVTGLTGTGKSTLINSLAGRRLSAVSAIRPTTTEPVVWAHRRHAGRYWQEFVARVEETAGPSVQVVLDDDALLRNLTLIDTPPPGEAGDELLGVADLAIFVTSATRYADAEGWALLDLLRGRGLPILFVLNKVPHGAGQAVAADFASKLAEERFLPDTDPGHLFMIFEHRVDVSTDGVGDGSVGALREELMALDSPDVREQLTVAADRAFLGYLGSQATQLAASARSEAEYGRRLLADVEQAYNGRLAAVGTDLEHGKYAHLAERWDADALAASLVHQMSFGAQDAAAAWSGDPVARRLVARAGEGLWHEADGATDHAAGAVAAWLDSLEGLAAERSARRRMWRFTRRRTGRMLRTAALAGAGSEPPPRLLKRYGDRGVIAVVRAARSALLDAAGAAFEADAARFRSAVGSVERLEVLAGVLEEKAVSPGSAGV